jgi:hypothetical protein
LRKAVSSVGDDPEKIKNYLHQNTFSSLTGDLKFDSDNEVLRNYNIVMVRDGVFKNFSTK